VAQLATLRRAHFIDLGLGLSRHDRAALALAYYGSSTPRMYRAYRAALSQESQDFATIGQGVKPHRQGVRVLFDKIADVKDDRYPPTLRYHPGQESSRCGADRCQESGMHLAKVREPQVSSSKHKARRSRPGPQSLGGKIKNLGWAQWA